MIYDPLNDPADKPTLRRSAWIWLCLLLVALTAGNAYMALRPGNDRKAPMVEGGR